MSVFNSWTYPLQGVVYLLSAPQLLRVVLIFLVHVTAASLLCTALWVYLFWNWHLTVLAKLIGLNVFSKAVTLLVLLSESALPVYLVFKHRFKCMQQQLFDATLRVRGVSVQPLQQQDVEALAALLAAQQKKRQEAASSNKAGGSHPAGMVMTAASALTSILMRIMFKPHPNEGIVVRKTRDIVTLGTSVFLPFVLPLMVYRDSHVTAAALLGTYWKAKGLTTPDSQELVAAQRAWELRAFGLVAAGLGYVPVLNWFLGLSNMVGAALYAAALEQQGGWLLPRKSL